MLAAAGSWTVEYANTLEPQVEAAASTEARTRSVAIDAAQIDRLDTFGAWLLERAMRSWTERGCETRLVGLREDYRGLFEKVHTGTHVLAPEPPKRNVIIVALERIGRTMATVGDDLVNLAQMIGALMIALKRVALRPWTFRLTSMVNHLERVAWQAVPIVLLITFLIGAILAQQGIFHFRKFGADIYVIDMVGVLVLREVGVLIVCIMVAGRSGSAYTAELGAMKMREEVDALRTMGFDPIEVLILPRIGACHSGTNPDISRFDSCALRRRGGFLGLRRHRACGVYIAAARGNFARNLRSGHAQGAVHGAGDRHGCLYRGPASARQRRVGWRTHHQLSG